MGSQSGQFRFLDLKCLFLLQDAIEWLCLSEVIKNQIRNILCLHKTTSGSFRQKELT